MGKNRNRNKRITGTEGGILNVLGEGISSSDYETTTNTGTRPKVKASSSNSKSLVKNGGAFSKLMEDKFNADINGSIKEYSVLLSKFRNAYHIWYPKRRNTIFKLKELVDNVHKDQLAFNSTNLLFKQMNVESRHLKTSDGSNKDFFGSLAALVTDALGGVTSIAQACNVENYMQQFNELMDSDVEFTKPLYEARSNCFLKYKDVEEIVRRYHSDTFRSTLNKISENLKIEDMWLDIKVAKSGDNFSQVLDSFDGFFRQISKAEVFGSICKSVEDYVNINPAVLDACEATGKALYGIYDTWGRDPKKNNSLVSTTISVTTNRALIKREEAEIRRLKSMVNDEDKSQAKLETTIQNALEGLEVEMKEIVKLYKDSLHLASSNATKYTNYYRSSDDDDDYCYYECKTYQRCLN